MQIRSRNYLTVTYYAGHTGTAQHSTAQHSTAQHSTIVVSFGQIMI